MPYRHPNALCVGVNMVRGDKDTAKTVGHTTNVTLATGVLCFLMEKCRTRLGRCDIDTVEH